MLNKIFAGVCALALAAAGTACGGKTGEEAAVSKPANVNNNAAAAANANAAVDSELRTETAGGVTTETRTFRDPNSRVERVVVTTRNGRRTARVHYRDRTVRELPESEVEQALGMTADALVGAGGKVVDVSKDVGGAVADKVEDVPGEAGDAARAAGRGAKKVGSEIGDKAEDVGGAAASGAKKAGKATAKGAKKVGGAIKNAVTP